MNIAAMDSSTNSKLPAEIRGTLVTLRRARDRDLDLLAGWFADREFVRWWGGVPLTRDDVARKYIGRRPDVDSFIVEQAQTPIGYIQAWRKGDETGIDVVLRPEAQRRGLGIDAVRALACHLSLQRGYSRVTVDPLLANKRAIEAFAKAGFVPEREWLDHPDGPSLLMVFDASKHRGA